MKLEERKSRVSVYVIRVNDVEVATLLCNSVPDPCETMCKLARKIAKVHPAASVKVRKEFR